MIFKKFTKAWITYLFLPFLWPAFLHAWPKMSCEQGEQALLYSTAEDIEIFKKDHGRYPVTLEELKPPQYHVNKDLNGNPPRYRISSDGKSFELVFGGGGKCGTSRDIKYDPTKRADNGLPMYGGPDVVKTPFQLESDEKFIQSAIQGAGSREKACRDVLGWGWEFFNKGDVMTAMKRFNQAWLLDPKNPEVYKGFSAVLKKQGKMEEADKMEGMIKK